MASTAPRRFGPTPAAPSAQRLVRASGASIPEVVSSSLDARRVVTPRRARLLDAASRARSPKDLLDVSALSKGIFTKRLPHAEKFRPFYGRIDMVMIQEVLRMADYGVMTPITDMSSDSMVLDPHTNSLAEKRFGSVASLEVQVDTRKGDGLDPKIAEAIATDVRQMFGRVRGLRQALYDLAWALFDGRASLEIDWQRVGGKRPWQPAALEWIHPRRIAFGADRELRIINTFTSGRGWWGQDNGVALDDYPGKFVSWTPRNFRDYPEREGLARRSMYWQLFKRFSARMRMVLTELFAVPWRTITFPPDTEYHETGWEDIDAAEEAAEALGGENTVAMPPGAELKVEWPGENTGQLFEMTRLGVNEELSKLWLGATATTDAKAGALGSGTADAHKDEQNLILARDAWGAGEVLQIDVADVYVVLNYGPAYLPYSPTVTLASKDEIDRANEQVILTQALNSSIPVSLATYYERTGLQQPEADEPVILTETDSMGGSRTRIVYPDGWEGPRWGEAKAAPPAPPLGDDTPSGGPGTPPAGPSGAPPAPAAPAGQGEPSDDGNAAPQGSTAPKVAAPSDASPPAPEAVGEDPAELRKQIAAARTFAHERPHPTVNGSQEELLDRGVREGIRQAAVWAQSLVDAVDDEGNHLDAHAALTKAEKSLDRERFARIIERTTVLSLCLGALDSAWETEAEQAIKPTSFERDRAEGLKLGSALSLLEIPGFTRMRFNEAIASFLSKKIVPRRIFDRLTAEAKRRAFTVAGLATQRMLSVAHDELTKAISDGIDLRDFRSKLAQRFEDNGWTPMNRSHVEVVFRTNISGAYASGRDVQMRQPAVLAARPYWQILGVNDDRVRDTHKAAHGKVLHASDPFWSQCPLPWGFAERCRKVTRSAEDLERLGLQVTTGASIAGLPDKGFTAGATGFELSRVNVVEALDRTAFRRLFIFEPELYADVMAEEAPPPAEVAPSAAPESRVYAGDLVVLIDRPKGTTETGTGADGQPWTRTWPFDAGVLPGTQAGDGEPIDVLCGPDTAAPTAWWIVQKGPDPELRLALGWADAEAVRAAYAAVVPAEMLDRIYGQPVEHVKAILGIAPDARLLEIRRLA